MVRAAVAVLRGQLDALEAGLGLDSTGARHLSDS
jgi:hypothetical protein